MDINVRVQLPDAQGCDHINLRFTAGGRSVDLITTRAELRDANTLPIEWQKILGQYSPIMGLIRKRLRDGNKNTRQEIKDDLDNIDIDV